MTARLVCALLVAIAFAPAPAAARQSTELSYPFDQVWGTTVRLLRVDYGFPIRDRDEEIGFVLFDYQDRGQSYQGSVEIIRTQEGARPGVRIVMQIPSMPSYVERMILDRLARKLREEFGLPVPPRPRVAEPPAEEAPREGEGEETPRSPEENGRSSRRSRD